MKQIKIQ